MKLNKVLWLASLVLAVLFQSCTTDPSVMGNVTLTMKTEGNAQFNTGGRLAASVDINTFRISIRDVAFKKEDDTMQSFVEDDIKFRGPFQVDLLNNGDAISQTIGSVDIPNGIYKEMRFKFHKDEDLAPTDKLYDRSIYLAGSIDGVPFEMWHDTSENLDIGRSTGVVVQDNQISLTVVFTIDQFMESLHQIDLTSAVDGNQDGLIEINTNDSDGNKEIADMLKENIKEAADLMDF